MKKITRADVMTINEYGRIENAVSIADDPITANNLQDLACMQDVEGPDVELTDTEWDLIEHQVDGYILSQVEWAYKDGDVSRLYGIGDLIEVSEHLHS